MLILATACLSVHLSAQAPRFSDFKVARIYAGKRAAPRVPREKREYHGFRAVWDDADKRPNFAGRYVLSHDTCGTNSVRLMITDAVTGRVDDVFCIFWDYDYSMPEPGLPTGVEYHPDSSLLIAHGCWDAEKPECGDHYFKMTPHGLVQIRWIPFNQRTNGMYAGTAAR
jgi:hypothetical protein